ncbi:hypothetical protein [uncultured Thiodictyon sp.]|uniref:hypothetical protein n=1 Tax=uncultured Thiodictyon sp. TaxID=1846217 RepID=UPI0025CEFABA|nr:hypothetical protein [uncultured Thiodictyon sp.]
MIDSRDIRPTDGLRQDAPSATTQGARKLYLAPHIRRIEVGGGTQAGTGSYNDATNYPDPGIS